MARTPFAERGGSLKVLGAAFVAMMMFFLWLTFAFFNKSFVDFDEVTLTGAKAGLNLPENADIKLRGMIVGEVRGIESTNGNINVTLGMDPDYIDDVPAGVTAEIIPKTLFGEKYISLIPPEQPTTESLKAGDTIQGAEVPIEVEKLLNDFYPLLRAVDPVNLNHTLSAFATALDGRGEELGDSLVTLNAYLTKLNPDAPQMVDDLVKFGEVSEGYANEMPRIGRFLQNSVTSGNTVVAKRTELASFFDEGTRLANTFTAFTKASGRDIEVVADQSRAPLKVQDKYSPTFECFFKGLNKTLPLADSVLRNRTVHIDLETIDEQPTHWDPSGEPTDPDGGPEGERALLPKQSQIDSSKAADPNRNREFSNGAPDGLGAVCEDLNEYTSGSGPYGNGPFTQNTTPLPTFPAEVVKLQNVKNSHNGKFGEESDFRVPVASLQGVDSADQRLGLRRLAAVMAGVSTDEIPDVASLLLGPVTKGAGVSVR
ncbi:MCE family protein [Aeromicrobium sp.]|uniref:MCE family protein n=1 Tax=Aeromicrobium sp. TaxID=1871063 RepID=UPI003D6ABCD5